MEPPADGKRRTRNRAGLRELQWKSAGLLGWLMALAAELRGRHPEDVELQLLEHLVRRREEHPAESWLDSYGEAWRALSRPALPSVWAASGWVTFREPPVPEATRRAVKGTPLQLLVDWGPCIREKRSD